MIEACPTYPEICESSDIEVRDRWRGYLQYSASGNRKYGLGVRRDIFPTLFC